MAAPAAIAPGEPPPCSATATRHFSTDRKDLVNSLSATWHFLFHDFGRTM
jgi:hypothetical protein